MGEGIQQSLAEGLRAIAKRLDENDYGEGDDVNVETVQSDVDDLFFVWR